MVTKIATLLTEIATIFPESKPVDPISILRWPGVMSESEIDTEPLYLETLQLLQETLSDLTEMRLSEGGRIQGMLTSRLAKIEEIVVRVRQYMPEILEINHRFSVWILVWNPIEYDLFSYHFVYHIWENP